MIGADPRIVQVRSLKNQVVIADQCHVAESYFVRLKGLMGVAHLEAGTGMLFPRCNNIHMWFMRIPIDVIFLSDSIGGRCKVSSLRRALRPWSLLPVWDRKAVETLELPAGAIDRYGIEVGDDLCIS